MSALDHAGQLELHVVAQVVEAELVVGAVGDIGAVGHLPLLVVELVLDDADRHAEEPVDAAHPLGVAAGQVVVDGDHVNALAFERVEIRGKRRDERLALAGLHLRDLPGVEDHAADQLDVVVPHRQHPAPGLADDGERLRLQLVERLAAGDTLPELGGLRLELLVRERLNRRLEAVDLGDNRDQPLQFAVVLGADNLCEKLA